MKKYRKVEEQVNMYLYGLKTPVAKYKCAYCDQEFKHYRNELLYQIEKEEKYFCSWTCKSKYVKENKNDK